MKYLMLVLVMFLVIVATAVDAAELSWEMDAFFDEQYDEGLIEVDASLTESGRFGTVVGSYTTFGDLGRILPLVGTCIGATSADHPDQIHLCVFHSGFNILHLRLNADLKGTYSLTGNGTFDVPFVSNIQLIGE